MPPTSGSGKSEEMDALFNKMKDSLGRVGGCSEGMRLVALSYAQWSEVARIVAEEAERNMRLPNKAGAFVGRTQAKWVNSIVDQVGLPDFFRPEVIE